jgi:aryl-alcohol dehydrogenase-like predicted oxidoreductase
MGIDYAIDNELSAERILPLAQERGIAVMVYLPFGRTRLWDRVRGKALPQWAAEFDAARRRRRLWRRFQPERLFAQTILAPHRIA